MPSVLLPASGQEDVQVGVKHLHDAQCDSSFVT